MLTTGLVSVTFRGLGVLEIAGLVRESGLDCIEWGGDIHVPHGDIEAARLARQCTLDAGLAVAAYGSYYRLEPGGKCCFEGVLETAVELGSPVIRVWAGTRGSREADDDYRGAVVEDALRIGEMAAGAGVRVAFEYHGGTLTDSLESTLWLMDAVGHANVGCMWQPAVGTSHEERLESLRGVAPWLANVHVFHWVSEPPMRRCLAEGEKAWEEYLSVVDATPGGRCALIEFVRDDDPAAFLEDARVLLRMVRRLRPR